LITSACETAATPLGTCVQQNCASACNDVPLNLGGDAGTGNVNVNINNTGGCSALSTCCATLPGAEQTACNEVVSANNASACTMELDSLQGFGTCG
jgi:hypothetical protein